MIRKHDGYLVSLWDGAWKEFGSGFGTDEGTDHKKVKLCYKKDNWAKLIGPEYLDFLSPDVSSTDVLINLTFITCNCNRQLQLIVLMPLATKWEKQWGEKGRRNRTVQRFEDILRKEVFCGVRVFLYTEAYFSCFCSFVWMQIFPASLWWYKLDSSLQPLFFS